MNILLCKYMLHIHAFVRSARARIAVYIGRPRIGPRRGSRSNSPFGASLVSGVFASLDVWPPDVWREQATHPHARGWTDGEAEC